MLRTLSLPVLLVLLAWAMEVHAWAPRRLGLTARCSGRPPTVPVDLHTCHAFAPTLSDASTLLRSLSTPAVVGGFAAGGLHAIAGPDHLAAILPTSVGRSGLHGVKVGATWGFGHGLSATALGVGAYFMKGKLSQRLALVERASSVAESAVGASLVIIGLLGVKESLDRGGVGESAGQAPGERHRQTAAAVLANGLLHGLSWDGLPSLAPAVAMPGWVGALSFLAAHALGTAVTMAVTAGLAGGLSLRLSQLVENPELPKKLALCSSVFAVAIGALWTFRATIGA